MVCGPLPPFPPPPPLFARRAPHLEPGFNPTFMHLYLCSWCCGFRIHSLVVMPWEDRTTDCLTDLISTISDPEHPHTLGQLSVVNLPDIHITRPGRTDPSSLATVLVEITPTITHCSLATVIGLAVRVRLEQALPPNYRVDIRMKEGAHAQDDQVNKQLADKERVAAALENDTLKNVLDKMLLTCA